MSKDLSLNLQNAQYLEGAYEAWRRDPASVPADLANFFEGFDFGLASVREPGAGGYAQHLQSKVNSLVYHYRALGHRVAQINPLGDNPTSIPTLELSTYGLGEQDLDTVFDTNHIPQLARARLSQILEIMRETYCRYIGVEYMHIQEKEERRWLQERMETTRNQPHFSPEQQMRILWKLERAEGFERFLHSTYRGQKRFSLEGSETLIPAFDYLIDKATQAGFVEIVVGMSHRGRLNVLSNILEKSYDEIFSEFEDNYLRNSTYGDGDVKYHKGFSNDVTSASGRRVHLSLAANPSHLEAVCPVVEGKARGKQAILGDTQRKRVLPFLIHGDAAFAGQGIVAETLNLSQLKGYRTGGTIHFVVNNQVGFTTTAQDYLSGYYATDVAKIVSAPVLHVNGDHPEYVLYAMDLALDYRQRFGKDVVIDMWCYRRYGHNEADEPGFTQPLLYERIAAQPSVVELYTRELAQRGLVSSEAARNWSEQFEASLEQARLHAQQNGAPSPASPTSASSMRWRKIDMEYSHEPVETGVGEQTLFQVARQVTKLPQGFNIHRKVQKLLEDFRETVLRRGQITWAQAEILAFGSLLLEGTGVRLSGEDSRRGTFSQRHAALYDQVSGDRYIPLSNLDPRQGQFSVYDSSLAEVSVLGFDYGYSMADPDRLILWEAQFGDFANGAQVIIDQFIAGSLSKWKRMSGLVMLLPHGYEGQGPEHSNAWVRRYLSLCAEDNMQVCNASTPAQYFHALRRQIKTNFRRPLVLFTPKSLLRNPRVVSPFQELTHGHFYEILDDTRGIRRPRRAVFCSGKVYYDLLDRVEKEQVRDVALVRVEQFYPLDEALWEEIAQEYRDVPEWVWVSEEPSNFGAWTFMQSVLSTLVEQPVWYVGRARSASPAVGSLSIHKRQQAKLLELALQPTPLQPDLIDGVVVFTRGEHLWHMKSKSHPLESPLPKAP